MSYICTKKLNLGGADYCPGDIIPDSAFAEGRAGKLKAYGYIAEFGGEGPDVTIGMTEDGNAAVMDLSEAGPQFADSISVVLEKAEEGKPTVGYAVSGEQLQAIVDIMQKNANDAADAIAMEVDETVLTFLAKVDSRKTVIQAARKQLAVINKINGGCDEPVAEEEAEAAEQ